MKIIDNEIRINRGDRLLIEFSIDNGEDNLQIYNMEVDVWNKEINFI